MHTLLHLALVVFSDPSSTTKPSNTIPSPPDNTLKVAIVGAIGLVLATAITAVASTFKRDASSRPQPGGDINRRYIAGLEHDRREYGKLRERYAHLREACFQRGLDPDAMIQEEQA